jgi:hypothetical protein
MLSKTLVGRVVDFIWGCRTCYTIFLSESDLINHREVSVPVDLKEFSITVFD